MTDLSLIVIGISPISIQIILSLYVIKSPKIITNRQGFYFCLQGIFNYFITCNLAKRQRHTSKLTYTHFSTKNNQFSNSQDPIPTAQRARGRFICFLTSFSKKNFFKKVVLAYKRGIDRNTKTIKHRLFLGFSSIKSKSLIKQGVQVPFLYLFQLNFL